MLKKDIEKYICSQNATIIDAMRKIDQNSAGIVYIVDEGIHLLGCLTDGDVRRWILKNGSTGSTVAQSMNRNPKFLYEEDKSYMYEKMEAEQIYSLAILNNEKVIMDIVFHDAVLQFKAIGDRNSLFGIPVVIMAGGRGTRLYPYTKILPKPLIPIGDIPILERIFERFKKFGVKEFYLTVNYRKEMIKSYLAETNLPFKIHFVEEKEPLGTAGSIRLIEEVFSKPVIITNCDILIDADYGDILEHHINSGNDMTIISAMKNISIPYGVLKSGEHGSIISMEEKPQISCFINTGMYVIKPEYISWIPEGRVFHMTDLAQMLIQREKKVGMYPISENSFLDMGQFEEMKKMEERINEGNKF